jgi:hypothetical protein
MTVASPPDPARELSTAITEAEEIALYTVRHGIDVPADILKTVVAARKKGPSDRWSEDELVKFWQAAGALAKLVHPSPSTVSEQQARLAPQLFGVVSPRFCLFFL